MIILRGFETRNMSQKSNGVSFIIHVSWATHGGVAVE